MVNRFIKVLSMFLAIVLLVNMLPLGIMAQELQSSATTELPAAETAEVAEAETGEIIAEIPEKRTKYSKEFLLSNGMRLATVYPEPVHYKTAKGWTDIDNTLVTKADGTYTNADAPWSVSFPKELTQEDKVTVSVGSYSLSFVMEGQVHSADSLQRTATPRLKAVRKSRAAVRQPGALLKEKGLHNDKSVPQKLHSQLTYTEVFENTDVVYDLESNAVKESIVLQQYDETLEGYRYTLYTGELTPKMDDTGHIDLYAPGGKEPVISLPSPYMVDNVGEYCDEVQVTLTGSDGVYTMTYSLPREWLASQDRAWPVILDPIVKANASATNIQDRTVCENGHISYKKSVFYAGYDTTKGKIRGYLQYNDLPILNSSDVIVNAELSLYKIVSSSSTGAVEVHKVTESWTSQGIEWDKQPNFVENISDYKNVKSQGWYSWNITDIVRDWYTEGNNGLMIKMPDSVENGTTKRFRQFYSSDAGASYRPKLSIKIRNNNGLEGYWDYTSASAGRAGAGHVNNFTGNLTWVREDMGFDGCIMPVSINHVYNLNDSTTLKTGNNSNMTAGNYFGMGNGWRINYSERIYDWEVDGTTSDNNYYIWEDADGTDHYFKSSGTNTYKDEDDLGLTLSVKKTDKKITGFELKDKQGNLRVFDSDGRLTAMKNNRKSPNTSSITITYVDGTQQIKTIKDSANREYRFTYENGLLAAIGYYGAEPGEDVKPLRKIAYGYDSTQNLKTVSEIDIETNQAIYTCCYEYTEDVLVYTQTGTADSQTPSTDSSDDATEEEEDIPGTEGEDIPDDVLPEETAPTESTTPSEETEPTEATEPEQTPEPTEPAEPEEPEQGSTTNNAPDESLKRYISVLTGATDPNGYKLTYRYYKPTAPWRPYRVQSIAETEGDNTGGCLTLVYGHNQTVFTDHRGQAEIHQFDDFGHTVCIQDDKGRAQFSKFTFSTDAEKDSNKNTAVRSNQLTLSSELQYSVANMMLGNNMLNSNQWTAFKANIEFGAGHSSTDWYSLRVEKDGTIDSGSAYAGVEYKTPFIVQPGQTHTFSCDIKSNGKVYLQAKSNVRTQTSKAVNVYTGWYRQQVSYTNDTDQPVSVSYRVLTKDYEVFYMDCPQLEIANNASRYNLVNDGDFSTENIWEKKNFGSNDGYVALDNPVVPQFNSKVLKITGEMGKKKSVSQKIYMDGKKGDSLIFAGWAKGNSAALGTFGGKARKFAIECQLFNDETSVSKVYSAVFNPDSNQWQYTAGGIVAEKDFNEVHISVVYDYNVNTALFDGIQLFKEAFGTTFQYASGSDSKRIVTVTDCNNRKTVYTYDKYDNLLSEKLPSGVTTTNTYNDFHNLTKSVSNGVTTKYAYDAWGNKIGVTVSDGTNTTKTTSEYIHNGNLLRKTTDAECLETIYEYDPQTGLLLWTQQTAEGETLRTSYSYDQLYRQTGQSLGEVTVTETAGEQSAEEAVSPITSAGYTYDKDLLTGIQTATTSYGFAYGDFSQRVRATVGNRTLAEYTYSNDQNRELLSLDYGNGDKVEYTYDQQGRVIKETYEDGDTVAYTYDNAGGVATVTDSSSGIKSERVYSADDQLARYTETGGEHALLVRYKYDTQERLSSILYMVDNVMGKAHNATYTYDDQERLSSYRKGNGVVDYTYDKLQRTTATKLTHSGEEILSTKYTFYSPAAGKASTRITGLTKTAKDYGITYHYAYDARGNITEVWYNDDDTKKIIYTYDHLNQLVKEDNRIDGYVHEWTYDNAGNIQKRKEYTYTEDGELVAKGDPVEYTYGDSQWGDLLTAYDGTAITYDEIGNPNAIGGWSFTWEHGRELASMSNGTATWTNTYNADGLRTKRTDSTLTYDYVYYSGQLMYMMVKDTDPQSPTKGSHHLILSYTPEGTPMGMTYQGTAYYYLTNLQGDVVAILNNQGQRIVSYSYDAWGNPTTPVIHVAADDANYEKYSTIAQLNPLRYRGYVYDTETGLYYVSSRYYDPEIGRWINADNQIAGVGGEVLGYNMFAYCMNNPVNMSDPSGNWPKWATKLVVAVAIVAVVAVVAVATAGTGTALACIAAGAAKGAAVGFAVGAATGAASGAISHRISTGSWDGAGEAALNGMADGALSGAITGAITGGMNSNVCFVAGTTVLSSTGFVAIETIRAGDKVWAENLETGEKELKEVVQTFANETTELIYVQVGSEEIVTTPEHPFYSPVKGWTAACELRAGDILVSANGNYVIVEKIQHEILETPITVYNFEVADFHTYYVGSDSILVHNVCGTQKALPKNGIKVNSSDALDLADDFLGKGYSEMSPGRFVSSDGLRQVRMTASDLIPINNHAGAPHLNFEKLVPNPLKPGKFQIIENSHVYIFD